MKYMIHRIFVFCTSIQICAFLCADEYTIQSLSPYDNSTYTKISPKRLTKEKEESPYPYESNQVARVSPDNDTSTWYTKHDPTHGYNKRD